MSRIRTIKPELIDDEVVAALSNGAFRLFVAAISIADDHGNFRAEPRHLFGRVFVCVPGATLLGAQEARDELSRVGLVDLYRVRGQTYAHLKGWEKHQRIDNKGRPKVPLPSDPEAEMFFIRCVNPRLIADESSNDSAFVSDSSESLRGPQRVPLALAAGPRKGNRKGSGNGNSVLSEHSSTSSPSDPDVSGSSSPVRQVFDYWAKTRAESLGLRGRRPTLDRKRRAKVQARLREGYSVEDLKSAVDGNLCSRFHVEGGHTDLELVCRDAEHVDRFLALDREARAASGLPDPEDASTRQPGALAGQSEPLLTLEQFRSMGGGQ